jgi:hypothetical protein
VNIFLRHVQNQAQMSQMAATHKAEKEAIAAISGCWIIIIQTAHLGGSSESQKRRSPHCPTLATRNRLQDLIRSHLVGVAVRPMGTNAAGFRRFCQGFADRENELGSGLNTSFAGFADFADGCEVKNNGGKQEGREGGVFFRIFLLDLRYWGHSSVCKKLYAKGGSLE